MGSSNIFKTPAKGNLNTRTQRKTLSLYLNHPQCRESGFSFRRHFTAVSFMEPYHSCGGKSDTVNSLPCVMRHLSSDAVFFCLLTLWRGPLPREQQPDETHSNYCNSAPKVVTGGRPLYPQHQPSVTQGNHKHCRAQTN